MKNTIFKFNNKVYHQIFGAPMGSSLSPIIAEILVQYMFKTAIKTCRNPPRIAKFFVDDSFLIIKKRHFQYFFNHINNLEKSLENIKFTSELENSKGELPFLDIFISRLNGKLKTQVYRKPTHSNRYLNFHSYHCLENKKSVIRTLTHRAYTHNSDENSMKNELKYINTVLENNNYPKKVVTSTIEQTLEKIKQREVSSDSEKIPIDFSKVISIPYINGVSDQIKRLLNKYEFKTVFKKGISVRSLLTNYRTNELTENHNLVYNIHCNDCKAVYCGQTKRKLKTRINEHKNALTRNHIHSQVAEHAFQTKHDINWSKPKIKYHENNKRARIFLESYDIEKTKSQNIPVMNEMLNKEPGIPLQYLPLLNK
jgi:RNase P protein component